MALSPAHRSPGCASSTRPATLHPPAHPKSWPTIPTTASTTNTAAGISPALSNSQKLKWPQMAKPGRQALRHRRLLLQRVHRKGAHPRQHVRHEPRWKRPTQSREKPTQRSRHAVGRREQHALPDQHGRRSARQPRAGRSLLRHPSQIETALATNQQLDYGWPYCYFENGTMQPDPVLGKSPNEHCDKVPAAYTTFTAHSSPLGFVLFPSTDTPLKDTFLVALHGAGHPRIGTGYKLVRFTAKDRTPAGLPHRLLPAHQNSRQARRRPRPRPPLRHLPHRPRQLLSHRRHPGHHLRHLSRAYPHGFSSRREPCPEVAAARWRICCLLVLRGHLMSFL